MKLSMLSNTNGKKRRQKMTVRNKNDYIISDLH